MGVETAGAIQVRAVEDAGQGGVVQVVSQGGTGVPQLLQAQLAFNVAPRAAGPHQPRKHGAAGRKARVQRAEAQQQAVEGDAGGGRVGGGGFSLRQKALASSC